MKAKVLRYELTDEGKKFYREKEVVGLGPQQGSARATFASDNRPWTKSSRQRGRIVGDYERSDNLLHI